MTKEKGIRGDEKNRKKEKKRKKRRGKGKRIKKISFQCNPAFEKERKNLGKRDGEAVFLYSCVRRG